jgi:hypothetical protein
VPDYLVPVIRGHNANLASDDAGIDDLTSQVARAVKLKAGLVILQANGDIRCDGKDQSRVTEFGTALSSELATLTSGDPNVRVFLVSSWGSVSSYVQYLKGLTKNARLKHAGKGLCQLVAARRGRSCRPTLPTRRRSPTPTTPNSRPSAAGSRIAPTTAAQPSACPSARQTSRRPTRST